MIMQMKHTKICFLYTMSNMDWIEETSPCCCSYVCIHPAEPPRNSEGHKAFSSVQMNRQSLAQAVIEVSDLTELIKMKGRKQAHPCTIFGWFCTYLKSPYCWCLPKSKISVSISDHQTTLDSVKDGFTWSYMRVLQNVTTETFLL